MNSLDLLSPRAKRTVAIRKAIVELLRGDPDLHLHGLAELVGVSVTGVRKALVAIGAVYSEEEARWLLPDWGKGE